MSKKNAAVKVLNKAPIIKSFFVTIYNIVYWLPKRTWIFIKTTLAAITRTLGLAKKEIFFDYADYNPDHLNRQPARYKDLIKFMLEFDIPKDLKILDVGSGTGWLAESIHKLGYHNLYGCDWKAIEDISPDAKNILNYKQIDLNKEGLSKYENQFADFIIISDVIEHLENPAFILRELSRVIKDDGLILLSIPNAFTLYERLKILFTGNSTRYQSERIADPWGHISMFTPNVMESLCDRANLDIIEKGKGYFYWFSHFWFYPKTFSHLWSYNASYMLRKKLK